MSSNIEWTDETWNPWYGCKKVSPGCKFCYMYREQEMYGGSPAIIKRSKTKFKYPLNRKFKDTKDLLIFTCSWSDFFIDQADEWRDEAWNIIRDTPHLTYQILTKRPERIQDHLPSDWGKRGYKNVWLGVSVEGTEQTDILGLLSRIAPYERDFKIFVSYEPALTRLDLLYDDVVTSEAFQNLDWMIIGGESGNTFGKYQYREANLNWFYFMKKQCREANVPLFIKQLGTHLARQMGVSDQHGRIMFEWPDDLKIREFPI